MTPHNLPQHWQWVTLREISETISKGTTPTGGKHAYLSQGIAFLRAENILDNGEVDLSNTKFISKEQHTNQLKRSQLKNNDILITIAGTLGRSAILKTTQECNTNQAVSFIRLKEEFSPYANFIQKYLSSPNAYKTLINQAKTTAIPNLTLQIISDTKIPLPPLEIQREIVEILESKLEQIASAKSLLESSLKECETYRLSLLNDAFNGNLTPHSKVWQWVNIQSVCKKIIAGGDKPLSFSQEKTQTHNIPIYANAIKDNGLYGWTTESAIQEPAITISARGTIGFVCPRFKPFFPIVRLLVAIPNEKIDLLFLSYALKHILPNGNGSSIPQLTIPVFKQLSIPLPPFEIQREIVEILESKLEKIASAKALLESSLKKCETYRLSLLESAFKGELK